MRHGEELHFADAARAELHVVLDGLPTALPIDAALHLAQRRHGAEVQVAAIDEGRERLDQFGAPLKVAGAGTHLHQRITLPVSALIGVVGFQRVE